MSQSTPILNLSIKATGSVTQKRFVSAAGAHSSAGTKAAGVSVYDGSTGDTLTVVAIGTAEIEAGAAINKDQEIEVTTNGKAIPLASGKSMGLALEDASGDGVTFEALLR